MKTREEGQTEKKRNGLSRTVHTEEEATAATGLNGTSTNPDWGNNYPMN